MADTHSTVLPLSLNQCGETGRSSRVTGPQLHREIRDHVSALLTFAEAEDHDEGRTFKTFEKELIPRVFELARLLFALFLCVRHERELERGQPEELDIEGKKFKRKPPQARNLNTFFGVVRYWRSYFIGPIENGVRRGFHPLDVKLGLTADRMSINLLSLATRLATKLSYAQTHAVLGWFLLKPPSTEVIEQAVLGLGRHTAEWFESAPAPKGDGDVLIILFDGKASPTATESELLLRRGKRRRVRAKSPRHRGRERRGYYGSKPRRKKGDKSKNGRVATMVVMYTLKRSGRHLLGPVNRRFYASFAPKRHAFEIARREADKRGFTTGSGKSIQILTDGDDDLALYTKAFFPEAMHTLDVMHALEYLWTAGESLYREGSQELVLWMEEQKAKLYAGRIDTILVDLKRRLDAIPVTGPGNKGKRKRLADAVDYLGKRVHQMNYGELIAADLEIATGAVEGAIKNIIGARFDKGGMRWIRERAEALLQLRCIEMNGDWDMFIDRVHQHLHREQQRGRTLRLQHMTPAPLPALAEAA